MLGALLGAPAAVHALARRRPKERPLDPRLVCLASLAAGVLLGCNLALEKVRL